MKPLVIRLPTNLQIQLRVLAKARKVSISEIARELIDKGLNGSDEDFPLTKSDLGGLLTKADLAKLEDLLTKADLSKLERLFASVFFTEQSALKTGKLSAEVITAAGTEASRLASSLVAKLGTKKAEDKS